MKSAFLFIFAICVWIGFTVSSAAYASPLACESIRNADQRNYCRAISGNKKSWCEFIKDADLRFRCRAEVK